jgi:hypothetical protein
MMAPFHLAAPIRDIEAARDFYCGLLGCDVGREAERWIDLNFFGHQLSLHVCEEAETLATNPVDGKDVPVRHFGAVLPWETWHQLRDKLLGEKVSFIIEPYIRFAGETGEQATMFFYDPSGNALEFKSFKDPEQLFAN